MKNVVVIGGNIAGLAAALDLKKELGGAAHVSVISKSDQFLFVPSLIWLPFGKRKPGDIMFPLAPTCEDNGVEFVHAEATRIDPVKQTVATGQGETRYDYLMIASGFVPRFEAVPGLEPGKTTHAITSLADALEAQRAWKELLNDPGPVVVGATQGAGCFGAAYEFLFNLVNELRRRRMQRRVRVTFVTPEPFAGHFGMGGIGGSEKLFQGLFDRLGIGLVKGSGMKEVVPGEIRLEDGRTLLYKYAMIMPPFAGAQVVRDSNGLGDANGLVPVKANYQHRDYSNIYAAGAAVAVDAPWQTPVAVGVPKNGLPAEIMAAIGAHNIACQVQGREPDQERPLADVPGVYVMDTGNAGVMILSDKLLPPRKHELAIPGPQAHWAKVAFEKYYLWKMRHGYVGLP